MLLGLFLFFVEAMSVFQNRGQIFILTTQFATETLNTETETVYTKANKLHLFVMNNTELVHLQNLSVKPFIANLNVYSPAGNDFIVASGLFHKKAIIN